MNKKEVVKMGKDCFDCENMLSAGGHCYHYGYVTDYDTDLRKYYLGEKDARNCYHYEPKDPDEEYDDSSSGGCFMTSACVGFMGKEDDCVELETMRHFRDTELRKVPGGERLIKEYYHVAPKIVSEIDKSDKKNLYYKDIYDTVLLCVDKINKKENDEAIKLYWKMFNKYKIIFNL